MFNGILSLFSSFIHFILGVSTPQSYPPPLNAKEEARLFTEKENGSRGSTCLGVKIMSTDFHFHYIYYTKLQQKTRKRQKNFHEKNL